MNTNMFRRLLTLFLLGMLLFATTACGSTPQPNAADRAAQADAQTNDICHRAAQIVLSWQGRTPSGTFSATDTLEGFLYDNSTAVSFAPDRERGQELVQQEARKANPTGANNDPTGALIPVQGLGYSATLSVQGHSGDQIYIEPLHTADGFTAWDVDGYFGNLKPIQVADDTLADQRAQIAVYVPGTQNDSRCHVANGTVGVKNGVHKNFMTRDLGVDKNDYDIPQGSTVLVGNKVVGVTINDPNVVGRAQIHNLLKGAGLDQFLGGSKDNNEATSLAGSSSNTSGWFNSLPDWFQTLLWIVLALIAVAIASLIIAAIIAAIQWLLRNRNANAAGTQPTPLPFCPQCGHQASTQGQHYCGNCGSQMNQWAPAPPVANLAPQAPPTNTAPAPQGNPQQPNGQNVFVVNVFHHLVGNQPNGDTVTTNDADVSPEPTRPAEEPPHPMRDSDG